MTPAELTPHQQAVALIAAAYPTPAWAPATLRAYERLLADIDADALRLIAMRWIQTRAERPTIADLRKAVADEAATAAACPYLDPDEAWGHVVASFTTVGGYREFPDTHPLVADVVRAIGWPTLCRSDNPEADRAHFLQLYRQRLERARRGDAATPGAEPRQAAGAPGRVAERHGVLPALRAAVQKLLDDVRTHAVRRMVPPTPVAVSTAPEIADAAELERREARRQTLREQAEQLRGER